MKTTKTPAPATPKMLSFLRSLYAERDSSGISQPDWDGLTAARAHNLIEVLLTRPRLVTAPPAPSNDPDIPAGFYAVAVPGDSQDLAFFEINRPDHGKWAGRTFLSQMASDERYAVRGPRRAVVLNLIAEDYLAAGMLFGQRIGRCCRCHRTLTNEDSRAKGIGPECEGKF